MTDRVSHGVPPLGFRTVPHASGKALERDPEGYELVHEIKTKLLDEHYSLTNVVRWLNEQGGVSNVSKARGGAGKWSVSTLKRVPTSQRTQGFRVMAVFEPAPTDANPDRKLRTGEKLVLDPEGQPIRMAEATFTDEEWIRIQAVLRERSESGKSRHMTPNPLAGIGYRGCGRLWRCIVGSRPAARCTPTCGKSGGDSACRGAKTLAEVEAMLEEEFLDAYGDEEMKRQKFVPGEDHSRELEQTEQSVERLRWESDSGPVDDENLYRSRLSALVARKAEPTRQVAPRRCKFPESLRSCPPV